MRRFFIESSAIEGSHATLSGSDARHMASVLRLSPGDSIILFDGTGKEYEAKLLSISPSTAHLTIVKSLPLKAESRAKVTIAQGFLKDKKMDSLIRHYTELGISSWYPLMAERSIPNPDPRRLCKRMDRWEKITRESLKQCGRGIAMEIGALRSFKEMAATGNAYDLKLFFWEKASAPLDRNLLPGDNGGRILMALGPEGGFSRQEALLAQESGFVACSLGPRILRAETASIASATLVQYLFGDMGAISREE